MSRRTIIEAIVGGAQDMSEETDDADVVSTGEVVLAAEGARGRAGRGHELRNCARGEILGLAGLPGSGAEEALDLLYGALSRRHGRLLA